jgi:hypothetical protein
MFDRRNEYEAYFMENFELGLHISRRISPAGQGDTIPKTEVVTTPQWSIDRARDMHDVLGNPESDFKPVDLSRYPLIIDKDVKNFEFQAVEGLKIAQGVGVAASQLLNHRRVQQYGNEKDAMDRDVLAPAGMALDTYSATKQGLEQLFEKWGDVKTITKPQGGALGKDIATHRDLTELGKEIAEGTLAANSLLQPFIDLTQPLTGLIALHSDQEEALQALNSRADRVREIRMHLGAHTDTAGQVHMWSLPTLRVGTPGEEVMKNWSYFALHPDSVPEGSYVHTKMLEIGRRVMDLTDVPQLYMAGDLARGITPCGDQLEFAVEANSRGPRMWRGALPAREKLMHMEGLIARQNYDNPPLA